MQVRFDDVFTIYAYFIVLVLESIILDRVEFVCEATQIFNSAENTVSCSTMTATESAWKKFLKLKKEVPVAEANVADSTSTLKRKRETVPEAPIKPKIKQAPREVVSQKTKKNRQKKKSKAKCRSNQL